MLLKRSARVGVRSHTKEVETRPLFRGKRKKALKGAPFHRSWWKQGHCHIWGMQARCGPGQQPGSAARLPAPGAKCKCRDLDIVPPNRVCMPDGRRRLCTDILTSVQPCRWMWAPSSATPGSSSLTACVFTPEGLMAKLLVCQLLNLVQLKMSRWQRPIF